MDTKEVLGERLKQMREANGLSLRKMQEQLGSVVSHTQLSKYEDGRDMPSSPVLALPVDCRLSPPLKPTR